MHETCTTFTLIINTAFFFVSDRYYRAYSLCRHIYRKTRGVPNHDSGTTTPTPNHVLDLYSDLFVHASLAMYLQVLYLRKIWWLGAMVCTQRWRLDLLDEMAHNGHETRITVIFSPLFFLIFFLRSYLLPSAFDPSSCACQDNWLDWFGW